MAVKGPRPYMDEALASLCSQGLSYEIVNYRCQPQPSSSTSELEIIIQDGDVEPDLGQSDAFNKGFAKARGEWLFWLNADDLLLPGALNKVKDLIHSQPQPSTSTLSWEVVEKPSSPGEARTPPLRSPGEARTPPLRRCGVSPHQNGGFATASWITGNELFVDAEGKCVGCSIGNGWHDWLYRHAVPHVHGPSAFFRRELLEKVGGFDASLRFCMDWDLWIRFMKAGAKFARIDDFLWAQRRWAGSKTQRDMSVDELESQWDEIREMLKKNDFTLTRGGVWLARAWRVVSGCYVREFLTQRRGGAECRREAGAGYA